jgi:hypothetical protein
MNADWNVEKHSRQRLILDGKCAALITHSTSLSSSVSVANPHSGTTPRSLSADSSVQILVRCDVTGIERVEFRIIAQFSITAFR